MEVGVVVFVEVGVKDELGVDDSEEVAVCVIVSEEVEVVV